MKIKWLVPFLFVGCSGERIIPERGGQINVPVPPEPPKLVECYKTNETTCKIEHLIFDKVNEFRKIEGRAPLVLSSNLSFVSRKWSESQGQSGLINHKGFPQDRYSEYEKEFGKGSAKSLQIRAENVALVATVGTVTDEVIASKLTKLWSESSGHRDNMLGNFNQIGIGIYEKNGFYYATQIFAN